MLKKNNLALLTLIIVGLVSSLITNIFAQKVEIPQTKPSVTITDTNVWQKYIEVSSLPIGKRPKVFSDLSKEMKANLFRFHLASQFVKHSNLTKVQKDFILESLSNLSADDYDSTKGGSNFESKAENLEARAKILFSDKEIFEIFANMQSDENDLIILKKYQNLVSYTTIAERNKAFRDLSVNDKRLIWKNKLALNLATQDFDKQNQDFILEGISLLSTDSVYSTDPKSKSQEVLNEFQKKALELFSKEQVFKLFMTLGGEAGCSLPSSKSVSATSSPLENDCSCRYAEWCQFLTGSKFIICKRGCTETTTGCGVFLGSPCIGRCGSVFNDARQDEK